MEVEIRVNGNTIIEDIRPDLLLIDFLRQHGCFSVKRGCETSNCGCCTVHLDGKPVLSCGILAVRCDRHEVVTLEGVREEAREFGGFIADEGGEQCGYCSPGLIMATLAMMREIPDPDDDEIKEYLANNLCRCSGYESQMRGIRKYIAWKKSQRKSNNTVRMPEQAGSAAKPTVRMPEQIGSAAKPMVRMPVQAGSTGAASKMTAVSAVSSAEGDGV